MPSGHPAAHGADMNTFWAIVANAVVIGGGVSAALLFRYWFVTLPERSRAAARSTVAERRQLPG
jgi:hypothetical protein